METKILCVGDVVGPEAVDFVSARLKSLRNSLGADCVILNGENAASGNGLDIASANALLNAGADIVTGGNHTWKRREIREYLAVSERVIRPANYPPGTPGFGYTFAGCGGFRLLVINLLGLVYMDPMDCPFRAADAILRREKGNFDLCVVDFHAEATSEKAAMAYYLDGRVSAVFGTHTHVATADERILPKGTGFITDIGMTGPADSILGIRSDIIVDKFTRRLPVKFDTAQGGIVLCGILLTLDCETGLCTAIERVRTE